MAVFAVTSPKLYFGSYEWTSVLNTYKLAMSADELDSTTFGNTSRKRLAGLVDVQAEVGGFTDFTDDGQDEQFAAQHGGSPLVTTIAPTTGAVGEKAHIFKALQLAYNSGGAVGEMHAFDASLSGDTIFASGYVLGASATSYTVGATNGAAVQAGAATAAQTVYATLHVVSAGATNVIVKIQSDANSGFTSATDRITFATATGITSEWKTLAGAVTDDYWRIVATVTGTGTWKFVCSLGIK